MNSKRRRTPRHFSPRSPLRLEPLEPRLLLTTLGVGDWFVYQQGDRAALGDGSLVRVDIVNDVTGVGTAEIMQWDAATNDVADIPGVLNGVDVFGGLPGPLGTVIGNQPWTNLLNVEALAISGTGQYFAVNNNTGTGTNVAQVFQIDPANSTVIGTPVNIHYDQDVTVPPTLFFNNIQALDCDYLLSTLWGVGTMVDLDAANPPAAVAGVHLITIDPATGEATLRATFIDPNVQITSIAFTPTGVLWGVRGGNELVTISTVTAGILTNVNLTVAGTGTAIAGMTGIDWVAGTLYGFAGGNLYSIDSGNGQCTLVGPVGMAGISGLANHQWRTDVMYGIDSNANGDRLVEIDLYPSRPATPFAIYLSESDAYTEVRMTVVVPYVDQGVTMYDDLRLWNSATTPYLATVNNTPVYAPAGSGGVLLGAVPSPVQGMRDRFVPVIDQFPYVLDPLTDDPYVTSALGVFPGGLLMGGITVAETGGFGHTGDLGNVYIGGTLAGRTTVPGSVENMLLGFFYGNTEIAGDLRTMYIQTNAGYTGGTPGAAPNYSAIEVGGTLGDLYVRGSGMYSEIYIGGRVAIPDPATDNVDWNNMNRQPILELEGRLPELLNARAGWGGFFDRYYGVDNLGVDQLDYVYFDAVVDPQTGRRTVTNNAQLQAQFLATESGDVTLWGLLDSTRNGDADDWYALSLEAGQTVRIHAYMGNVNDPREGGTFLYELRLLGPGNALLGTYGYETYEDIGIGSAGTVLEPLTFTAQEPGLYYFQIQDRGIRGLPYTIFVDDAVPTTLGGMRVSGTYDPIFTFDAPSMQDIFVGQGNIGVITTDGMALGPAVYAQRGSIVDFEADHAGYNPTGTPPYGSPFVLQASNNIGRVESRLSDLVGSVIAGAATGYSVETDANIQMIKAARYLNAYDRAGTIVHTLNTFSATGSIGYIVSGNTISSGMTIMANSDQAGPPASIDLISIGGDWGALAGGPPALLHGVNGNVRFMSVAGNIYVDFGSYVGILNPTVITSSITFADDGGGVMTISPGSRKIPGAAGQPATEIPTIISFYTIPVDDAVGGVLSRMTISGPASFSAAAGGKVEISNLALAGTTLEDTISFKGGRVDIYNVTGGPIGTLDNRTPGDILFGSLTGITTLRTGGNLGHTEASAGTRIPGPAARPGVSAGLFGWYNGTLNGLQLGGAVDLVSAGGSIGDLYFTGAVNRIVADSDGVPSAWGWDGVRGTIYAVGRIGSIDVGDGLMDDGSADIAQAGIFGGAARAAGPDGVLNTSDDLLSIGTVLISRQYERVGNIEWGLLNGAIIGVGGIEKITGTNGARTTAIMGGGALTDFRVTTAAGTFNGAIGTVSFSGTGAQIYRAEIYGTQIGAVLTSKGSLGIVETDITADQALANNAAIGRIEADGPGIIDCRIGANGGWIGTLRGTGAQSDLIRNYVDSTDSIKVVTARHIYGNLFEAPRMMDELKAAGNMNANTLSTGGISKVTIAGDMLGNVLIIAGPVNTLTVGGEFYSTLILQGPQVARLGRMIVTGPIGGVITSAGKIDLIQSRTGDISADISTLVEAINGNIGSVTAAGAFTGNLVVSGNLGLLSANGIVGVDPSDNVLAPDHRPRVIQVGGNFDTLLIGGKKAKGAVVPLDLYSDIIVNGDFGKVTLGGGLFGDLLITGNVGQLVVAGDIGRLFDLGGPLVMRGNIEVRGSLKSLKLAKGSSVLADVTFGRDMAAISVVNGILSGNLTSLYGSIPSVTVTGGQITGNITANLNIGTISVKGAKGGPSADITGDITAQNGSIVAIVISGGSLDGNVAANTSIGSIKVAGAIYSGYDANPFAPRPLISAGTFISRLEVKATTPNANIMNADVQAGTYIGSLSVRGGNLTGDVNAETGITSIALASEIRGATIRSGGQIGKLSATSIGADPLTGQNPLISAAGGIASFDVKGDVNNATVLAGYDVGPDGLPLTGDDLAHSGSFGKFSIRGAATNSVFAAGIGPRLDNGLFFPFFDGADWAGTPAANRVQVADGYSAFESASVRGALVNTIFVADSAPARGARGIVIPTVDTGDHGYPLGPAGNQFGAGNPTSRTFVYGGATLTFSLSGGGTGSFDPATGQVALAGTTGRTRLTITNTAGPVSPPVHIGGADDTALGSLQTGAGVTLGNMDLDGPVGRLTTSLVGFGSTLGLYGGVARFTSTNPAAQTFSILGGPVTAFASAGPLAGGNWVVDSIGSMTVAGVGGLGANVTTTLGGITKLAIAGGDLTGTVTSRGTIGSLSVTGAKKAVGGGQILGDVRVTHGDLAALSTTSNVAGDVVVERGRIGKFAIKGGSFRNVANPADVNAVRSLSGVDSFSITGGDFAGVLSTEGVLSKFTCSGVFNGRLRALSGISRLDAGAMTNAIVASGSSISQVTIRGNMTDSYLFSGFDTEDDLGAPTDNALDNNRDDAIVDRLVASTVVTNPDDVVRGGDILRLTIGGNMVRSAISAAVGPGTDGYLGNSDDLVVATGVLFNVQVAGTATGSGGAETYGFSAATSIGRVVVNRQAYVPAGNVVNHARIDPAGAPRVLAVDAFEDSVRIAFNQPIDVSSIHGPWYDGLPSNIQIIASINNTFGDGDDYIVTSNIAHTFTYDAARSRLTLSLNARTFLGLNQGTHFLLIVDGTYDPGNGDFSAIMDASGDVLDGEFTYLMPTGDGEPGGNLLYRFDLGDAGDTAANATDLTHTDALPAGTYRPLLMYNEVKGFRGTIGDNPNLLGINRANDVDVYRVDAVQGDILYVAVDDPFTYYVQVWTWDGAAWVEEFPDSLSGEGYYTEALTETYRVSVCTNTMGDWVWNPVTTLWEYVPPGVVDITTENSTEGETTGLYELYLHLFDDYNSNFTTTPLGANFDATQTPTPLTWVGNTAMPQSIDAHSRAVQVISTPDDVDIYRLDNVPDLTRLDLLVKSWSIGSGLDPYVALFNADGALVSSIGFPGGTGLADVWRTPEGYLDTPIISAYVPDATPGPGGSATYYVAIWGGDLVGPFDGEFAYQLTVTKTEPNQPGWTAPAWALPVRPPQTVYLNFRGGDEAFLVDAFGPGTEPYVDPFQASVFGFGLPAENIQMINQIANQVRGIYAGYNITFTTERPLVGEYTEIKISGAQAPQVGVYGLAEQIDPLNTDLTDVAVVWAGEMADDYNVALGYTMAEIAEYVGGTAAHELGHLLGLNHNTDPFAFPTLLMEPFTSPGPYAFGTGALVEYLVGYQTDSVLLRAIA